MKNAHLRYNPNSLAASRDPKVLQAITKGRSQANQDRSHMETWARQGFSSLPKLSGRIEREEWDWNDVEEIERG